MDRFFYFIQSHVVDELVLIPQVEAPTTAFDIVSSDGAILQKYPGWSLKTTSDDNHCDYMYVARYSSAMQLAMVFNIGKSWYVAYYCGIEKLGYEPKHLPRHSSSTTATELRHEDVEHRTPVARMLNQHFKKHGLNKCTSPQFFIIEHEQFRNFGVNLQYQRKCYEDDNRGAMVFALTPEQCQQQFPAPLKCQPLEPAVLSSNVREEYDFNNCGYLGIKVDGHIDVILHPHMQALLQRVSLTRPYRSFVQLYQTNELSHLAKYVSKYPGDVIRRITKAFRMLSEEMYELCKIVLTDRKAYAQLPEIYKIVIGQLSPENMIPERIFRHLKTISSEEVIALIMARDAYGEAVMISNADDDDLIALAELLRLK